MNISTVVCSPCGRVLGVDGLEYALINISYIIMRLYDLPLLLSPATKNKNQNHAAVHLRDPASQLCESRRVAANQLLMIRSLLITLAAIIIS